MNAMFSRRQLLTAGLGAGVLLATGIGYPAAAAPATTAAPATAWRSGTTANGWPVVAAPAPAAVQGTTLTVALLPGAASTVLLHCLRRYFYEIDGNLAQGDVTGYSADRSVSAAFESNYSSGTALAIRPNWYPLGVADGFLPRDVVIIRDILADCEGVVRWGGDLDPVKESHFQIDVKPHDARLAKVAGKIDGWRLWPGQGAGGDVDPFSPARRRVATALQAQQQH